MPVRDDHATIAAISTPPGAGGIGVIRMSGAEALPVLQRIFQPRSSKCRFHSHRLYYGHIAMPGTDRVLDEVLAVYMQAPHTYTREDVVEIQCHGSFLVLQAILELIFSQGVVPAAAGEFTKRAFLNGRIDLTQAEAVIDILAARTRKGMELAQQQLEGALYRRIDSIRKSLVQMRALIEVAIDFPDEDIEIVDYGQLINQLRLEVLEPLQRLLDSVEQGRIIREGISVVIAGLPNVGKSSLLNTMLQEERALVTEIPGTTRDTIEEYLDVHGMPVRLVDTAGIRDATEKVEELGIQRARKQIGEADLVLFMIDGSRAVSQDDRELFSAVRHKPLLLVVNKIDLVGDLKEDYAAGFSTVVPVVAISAAEQVGIDELKDAIFRKVTGGRDQWEEEGCAPNLRHKQSLLKAHEACARVLEALAKGYTSDLIAVDLQESLDQLGVIIGETTPDDILDVIFEQFCLGK